MKWQTRSSQKEQVTPEIVDSYPSSDSESDSEASEESDEDEEMDDEIYFDKSTMTWTTKNAIAETKPLHGNETQKSMSSDRGMIGSEAVVEDSEDEFYFDSSEMRWKTRSRIEAEKAKRTDYEAKVLYTDENEKESGEDENSEEVSRDRIMIGISHVLYATSERCCQELSPVLSSLWKARPYFHLKRCRQETGSGMFRFSF
jgi:hypothetical protein